MEIKKEHIIGLLLVLLIVWVCVSWDMNKESFIPYEEKYWKNRPYQKWGNWWYYQGDDDLYQPVPEITNYNDSTYHLSEKSNFCKDKISKIPKPHNIHTGETELVGYTDNIKEQGAPFAELVDKDIQSVMPYNSPNSMTEENQSILYELPTNAENTVSEEKVQYSQHGLGSASSEANTPQLVQEHIIQDDMPVTKPIVVVNTTNYSLSIIVLLIIVLLGFAYYTNK